MIQYQIDYTSRYGQDLHEWVNKDDLIDRLQELMSNFCKIKLIMVEGYEE